MKLKNSKTQTGTKTLIIAFISITVILLFVIAYFTLSRARIEVIPRKENLSASITFEVSDQIETQQENTEKILVPGETKIFNVSDSYTTKNLATKEISGKSSGFVIVKNNYSQSQPLVKTTRFIPASKPDLIFRTQETVKVPAGGQVEIELSADEDGEQGDIPADTKFTIPGLWEGLQEQITGENAKNFTGGKEYKKIISEQDIDDAKKALEEKIKKDVLENLKKQNLDENKEIVLKTEEISTEISGQEGDEAESLTASMEVKITAIIFDKTNLYKAAKSRLESYVPKNKEMLDIDQSKTSYTLFEKQGDTSSFEIKMYVEADMIISNAADFFDPTKLTSKSPIEVKKYFEQYGDIQKVNIKLAPFWIKQTPALPNNIKFEIKK